MSVIARDRRYVPRRRVESVSGRRMTGRAYIDEGREETNLILGELEQRIYDVYREAAIEMREKANRYLEQFRAEDYRRRALLLSQGINPKNDPEYRQWRTSQIAQGRRWMEMADILATDMAHHNEIAASAIRGYMPEVYACGYNYGLYSGERQAMAITPFTLYDRRTVERLLRDNPQLLPQPRVDIPKDKRWNQRVLTSQIEQGIIQGETMDQIADRLSTRFTDMNRTSAIRTARTAVTGAENAGRLQSALDLESAGIKMVKTWSATNDDRTRDSHAEVDGETIGVKEKFSNGLEYPGDPSGDASEVYNCRCTLVSDVVTVNLKKGAKKDSTVAGESYPEWKQAKQEKAENEERRDLTPPEDSGILNTERAESEQRFRFEEPIAGAEDVNSHLDAMPENERTAWERNLTSVRIEIDDDADIEHFDSDRGVVVLRSVSKASAVFHEVSHAIDATAVLVSNTYSGQKRVMGEWIESFPSTVDYPGVTLAIESIYEAKSDDGYGTSQYRKDMSAFYDWAGIPHKNGEALIPGGEQFSHICAAIREFRKEYGEDAVNVLSDMIDAITMGEYPMSAIAAGHGKEYWTSNASLRFAEAWAEFSELRATQNERGLAAIRDILPAITDAVEEVWRVVYDGRVFEHVETETTDRRISQRVLRVSAGNV